MQSMRLVSVLLVAACVGSSGCRTRLNRSSSSGETPATTQSADTAKTPVASANVPSAGSVALAPSAALSDAATQPRSLKPVGIPHAVEPGMGLGPIMFGATVATIERHMAMKCEVLTETRCLIITAGVEFALKQGVLSGIKIHRFNRPVDGDKSKSWGVFAGGIPPRVMMGMVPDAVVEALGKPKRTETVKDLNPNGTVRRDFYDGMVLEYDLNPTSRRLMLGEIQVVKKG